MAKSGQAGSASEKDGLDLRDRLGSAILIGLIRLLGLLPFRWRVPACGWLVSRVVGPLIGYRKRIRENLDLIFPGMPEREKRRMMLEVPRQLGRTLCEMFSPRDLLEVARKTAISGTGWPAVETARASGRPIIFVSGHIGNYDIARAKVIEEGILVGGLYRSLNFRRFNEFYVSRISEMGGPLFPRGRRGMAEMVKFLKDGNAIAIAIDQHMTAGAPLTFFGKTAYTALSAADLALRYDALLVPCYALRQPDGVSFEIIFEEPIPHSTPEEMTQAINDSLERQVRAHMDQWLWVHRRWKGA